MSPRYDTYFSVVLGLGRFMARGNILSTDTNGMSWESIIMSVWVQVSDAKVRVSNGSLIDFGGFWFEFWED